MLDTNFRVSTNTDINCSIYHKLPRLRNEIPAHAKLSDHKYAIKYALIERTSCCAGVRVERTQSLFGRSRARDNVATNTHTHTLQDAPVAAHLLHSRHCLCARPHNHFLLGQHANTSMHSHSLHCIWHHPQKPRTRIWLAWRLLFVHTYTRRMYIYICIH